MKHQFRSTIMLLIAAILSLSLATAPSAQAQTNSLEANKMAVATLLQAMSAPGDFTAADALIASDFVVHFDSGDIDWDTMKVSVQGVITAMPDVTYTPLIMLAEGNRVALRYDFTGTFTSPLVNFDGSVLPPTNAPVVIQSNAILTFNDAGQIVEFREVFDSLSFFTQLGAFPMPEAAPAPMAEPLDPSIWTIAEVPADFTDALESAVLAANTAAYNAGDIDALDAVTAPEYISYPTMVGLDENKAQIAALRAAIPDLQTTTDLLIAEGNWIAYLWTAAGTFSNPFDFGGMQLPPTNQPIQLQGITFAVANADGLIVAEWSEVDNLSFGMQFGMFPAAGQ